MSNKLNDDQKTQEKRVNRLRDSDDLVVEVSPREQISEDLYRKLTSTEVNAGETVTQIWNQGNSDRSLWLTRQQEYLTQFDEFIDPIYESSTDWSSTLHLPTILTVAKTFHARFYSAILGQDPPFTVKSRTAANVNRARLVQELLRYTLRDWANCNLGVNDVIDRWVWDWCTTGVGILKAGWDVQYSRFKDVEEVQIPTSELSVDPQTGESIIVPSTRTEERVVDREAETFNGPEIRRVSVEDLLIIGGEGDPQKADYVIESMYLTASELNTLADRKIFRQNAVDEIIRSGDNRKSSDVTGNIKQQRFEQAGQEGPDREYDLDRYQVLEAYVKMDVDGSGINSDIVVWVHPQTREILRATYLYRIMPTGQRPYFKADFYKRNDSEYGAGLVELLYSLGREIDAMHNMNVDIGILTSMPFGFYQPSAGTPEEKLEIEPGSLIPVDQPSANVFFPNLGNRTSFGFQEEGALMNHVQRLTSLSDLSFGVIGGQGATRTATGTRALVGEANANLDIFLQRINHPWKQVLKYLFHLLQMKMPPGFQFRITGDDGNSYWAQVESRQELAGMFDFELEANSSNSNPQIQQATANQTWQIVQNPLLLQLGIVTPKNLYEAAKGLFQSSGVKDFARYITEPQGPPLVFTPLEVMNRTLAGIPTPLDPTQDLQGIIELAQAFQQEEELNGQLGAQELAAIGAMATEAQQMMAAMQAQQQQQANLLQQQVNQGASQIPGQLNVNVLAQTPQVGEEP